MSDNALEELYTYAILPQFFNVRKFEVIWTKHEMIGPDDSAHYATVAGDHLILMYRDYGAMRAADIKEMLGLNEEQYEVFPHDPTMPDEPALRFGMEPPFTHCNDVTGYFTLVRLLD